jgi:hypothetical protein
LFNCYPKKEKEKMGKRKEKRPEIKRGEENGERRNEHRQGRLFPQGFVLCISMHYITWSLAC